MLIMTALTTFGVAIVLTLPRIIWAVRCGADSPNYKCPSQTRFRPPWTR